VLTITGRRDIQALCVKCSNVERGCEWVGRVSTFQEHSTVCKLTQIPCPKQCGKSITRKELNTHLVNDCPYRDYECEYCGEKGTHTEIEIHDGVCLKKVVPCPSGGCGASEQRGKIQEHVDNKCLFAIVPCKFRILGCDKEVQRKDIIVHEQDAELHLHIALGTVMELKLSMVDLKGSVVDLKCSVVEVKKENAAMKSLQNEVSELKDKISVAHAKKETWTFALSQFSNKKKANAEFAFPSFYCSRGYHMALTVYPNGSNRRGFVSVHLPVLKGKHDTRLKWPFTGEVTLTLLNQLEDRNHLSNVLVLSRRDNVCAVRDPGGNGWGLGEFIHHSQLQYMPCMNTQYLKDDALYFRVEIRDGMADHVQRPWLQVDSDYTTIV
jgi:hypothetical protein